MSDNFVKRNLKRKSSFQYKKQRVAQKTQASRDSDFDEGESSSKLHNYGGSSRESVTVKEGGGLNSWGVDPLTLSLDFLQRLPKATVEAKAPPTAATGTEEDTGKTVRGLNVSDGKVIDKKKLLDVAFLHDSRKYSNEALTLLQQLAPKCNGHQMPARLLTVNKSGNNKVRKK